MRARCISGSRRRDQPESQYKRCKGFEGQNIALSSDYIARRIKVYVEA